MTRETSILLLETIAAGRRVFIRLSTSYQNVNGINAKIAVNDANRESIIMLLLQDTNHHNLGEEFLFSVRQSTDLVLLKLIHVYFTFLNVSFFYFALCFCLVFYVFMCS